MTQWTNSALSAIAAAECSHLTLTSSMKSRHSLLHVKSEVNRTRARRLAWPILGGWGPSDSSSNLDGPTQSIHIWARPDLNQSQFQSQ